jgi:hypothetical protein
MISGRNLEWRGDALCHRGREQARIVPDQTYPGMWRVQMPDRPLTDMLNKTRARDDARALVLARFNVQETPLEGAQRGVPPSPASRVPGQANKRPSNGTPQSLGREATP